MTRFRVLMIGFVVAVIGYSVLWAAVVRTLSADLDVLIDSGTLGPFLQIEAGGVAVEGFPYRITVVLDDARISDTRGEMVMNAKRVEAITHLWTPGHWVLRASDVSMDLPVIGRLEEAEIAASYKRRREGHAGIYIGSSVPGDTVAARIPGLTDWSLSIGLPASDSQVEGGLYADVGAFVETRLHIAGSKAEAKGRLFAAPLLGTDTAALQAWRDAGGLLEFETLKVTHGGGSITGNASVGLDGDMMPLGSIALTSTTPAGLDPLLKAMGLPAAQASSAAIILQNGRAVMDGQTLGRLRPITRY